MRFAVRLVIAWFIGAIFINAGFAQEANWSARIDSPFAGPVWRLAASGDESIIAVSSADETVTTWALDLELARSRIALQRRDGLSYRARALAIDPVTGVVAVSIPPVKRGTTNGAEGALIELRSPSNGSLVHRIETNLPTRPQSLAFSPNGDWLAAVLSEGCGLRMWFTSDWSLVHSDDADYGGCGTATAEADTTELRFLSDEPLVLLTSGETGIRRYELKESTFARTAFRPPDALLQRPDGLALSPDKIRLAVGDRRRHDPSQPVQLRIAILDPKTLEDADSPFLLSDMAYFYDAPDTPISRQLRLNRIVWEQGKISAGGVLPCSGALDFDAFEGETQPGSRANCLVRWQPGQTAEPTFLPVGDEAVIDMLALTGRQALAVATRNAITLYAPGGTLWLDDYGEVFEEKSPFADFRQRAGSGRPLLAFDVSDDGKQVFFEPFQGNAGLTFNVQTLTLTEGNNVRAGPGLNVADIDANLFGPLPQWINSRAPAFAVEGMLLESDVLRSVAAFSNGAFALVGTADSIQIVDMGNKAVACRLRVTSEAFRVNIADDNRIAIVGHGDGTLRWYSINFDGAGECRFAEELAVNIRRAAQEQSQWTWHAWITKTGHFASDAAAKPDMTWQRTRDDGSIELVDFAAVSALYSRDAIKTALERKPERAPDAQLESRDDLASSRLEQARMMSVNMLAPTGKSAVVKDETVDLALMVEGEGPWPRLLDIRMLGKISVEKIVDDKRYAAGESIEVAGPGFLQAGIVLPARLRRKRGQFDLCFAINGQLRKPCSTLAWNGDLTPHPKPRLWAVLAGFSDYSKGRLASLKYAQNDALDMARLLADDVNKQATRPGEGDYADVRIDLIVAPTTQDARDELEELAKLPFVTVHEPGVASVRKAFSALAKRDENEALIDDIVLFAYSGHGTSVSGRNGRATFLLDPALQGDMEDAAKAGTALSMEELIDTLSGISSEQVLLVDACRSFSQVELSTTIDPAFENTRLSARANPAHVVFSARVGQYSPESSRFSFAKHRKENGNGIFAYSVLEALTSPAADSMKGGASKNRIEVDEVRTYLGEFFRGPAQEFFDRVRRARSSFIPPEPVWIPSGGRGRSVSEQTILRSLPVEGD